MSKESRMQNDKKAYLLDANVYLTDPNCVYNFEDNYVVVLETCINEIDRFKKENSMRGAASRETIRILSSLNSDNIIFVSIQDIVQECCNVTEDFLNEDDVTFVDSKGDIEKARVYVNPKDYETLTPDEFISRDKFLMVSNNLMYRKMLAISENNFDEVIIHFFHTIASVVIKKIFNLFNEEISHVKLVSNDNILRLRLSKMYGIEAETYKHNQVDTLKIYNENMNDIVLEEEDKIIFEENFKEIEKTFTKRSNSSDLQYIDLLVYDQIIHYNDQIIEGSFIEILNRCTGDYFNTFFKITINGQLIYIFKYYNFYFGQATGSSSYKFSLRLYKTNHDHFCRVPSFYGLKPRNEEQFTASQALLMNQSKLIALTGKAGTGKTLIALATALEEITNKPHDLLREYKKVIVVKPIEEIGKEMGSLPGNVEEKMEPFLASFYDCFTAFSSPDSEVHKSKSSKKLKQEVNGRSMFKDLEMFGLLEVQPLAYLRGRTISNAILIVDEAQNCSYDQLKAIITRAGENTKIILCGDPDQCELNFINKNNSGLSQVIDKFKNNHIFTHIHFTIGERSILSDIAGKIL